MMDVRRKEILYCDWLSGRIGHVYAHKNRFSDLIVLEIQTYYNLRISTSILIWLKFLCSNQGIGNGC